MWKKLSPMLDSSKKNDSSLSFFMFSNLHWFIAFTRFPSTSNFSTLIFGFCNFLKGSSSKSVLLLLANPWWNKMIHVVTRSAHAEEFFSFSFFLIDHICCHWYLNKYKLDGVAPYIADPPQCNLSHAILKYSRIWNVIIQCYIICLLFLGCSVSVRKNILSG